MRPTLILAGVTLIVAAYFPACSKSDARNSIAFSLTLLAFALASFAAAAKVGPMLKTEKKVWRRGSRAVPAARAKGEGLAG